jgi:hypothetical protein
MLLIRVFIEDYTNDEPQLIREYVIDHDNLQHRRVLGEQCRNAFEAGQAVQTIPEKSL